MDYHVVRMNEKIDQIALTYNLSIDEIKSNNQLGTSNCRD